MKITRWQWMATFLTLLTCGNAWSANEVQYSMFKNEARPQTAAYDAQGQTADIQLASHDGCGCEAPACGSGCGSCGEADCCRINWCDTCPGMFMTAELLYLRAHDSEASSNNTAYETGSRYTLGYQTDTGRALQLRYFEYYNEDFDDDDVLNLETLDAEYAGRFTMGCNWRGQLTAGLRYAKFVESDDFNYEDTIGPVLGAQIRGLQFGNLDTFAGLRQSFQFGSVDNGFGNFNITEAQLGVEYRRDTNFGSAFVQNYLETQYWSGPVDNDSEDLGLIGFGFMIGLSR